MRIGLNATCFNDRPSGARQRFVGLYGALIRSTPDVDYVIYEPSDCRVAAWFGQAANVTGVRTPLQSAGRYRRFYASIGYWRRQVRLDSIELFEIFSMPVPMSLPCPIILTTHDVRSTRSGLLASLSRLVHRWAFDTATVLITVSQTMREELSTIAPRAQIVTIYNGVDPTRFKQPIDLLTEFKGPYLLSVGHFETRKNFVRLIQALTKLRKTHDDLQLVLVGNESGGRSAIDASISKIDHPGAVHVLHDVGDAELVALYRGARAIVIASTYEGFGIPLIEAMAAGRPLITSNIPVFVELTEGQGAMFDPENVEDIAAKISNVLTSVSEQKRLIDHGRIRVREFDFEDLAKRVASLHRQILSPVSLPNGSGPPGEEVHGLVTVDRA